jgi:hypothetical protein
VRQFTQLRRLYNLTLWWYQHLEQQEKQEGDINSLVEGLASIIPSVESVRGLADSNLGKTVTAMLSLIEDASLFIVNYRSHSSWSESHLFDDNIRANRFYDAHI